MVPKRKDCWLTFNILQLFTIINAAIGETVRIQGVLACGGTSVVGARLKLYDGGAY
ncbi:hypothetical protein LOAG_18915 [Loa loa]|uniref:Uncharacterized protein n=1 Tax=Loa loa TaxID=7209 RepID=A0A1S0UDP2_LOALO|nr:hypothetical protein LOAG_18915 [Loa loa]EJD73673.1 hypothetical protein LOAG_18915 [Loa loa]